MPSTKEEVHLVAEETTEQPHRDDEGQVEKAALRGESAHRKDGLAFEKSADENCNVAIGIDQRLQRLGHCTTDRKGLIVAGASALFMRAPLGARDFFLKFVASTDTEPSFP